MATKIVKHQILSNQTRGLFENSSANDETRTVDLVWTTGYKGLRTTKTGFQYYEELAVSEQAIDTSRMVGNPLLASHDSENLDSVIGVIESVSIDPKTKEGRAKVRFAKDEFSERTYQKVKDKILNNVSVGYRIDKMKDVSQRGDEIPTYLAERWSPYEISIVPIGFDPGAQVRNQGESVTEVEIEINSTEAETDSNLSIEPQADLQVKERTMTDAEKKALELEAKKQAALEEKQRQSEIRLAVRNAKLDNSFADELCEQDITADQARKLVLEKLASVEPTPVQSTVRVEVGTDNEAKRMQGFKEALLHRANPKLFKQTELSRDFSGKSLIRQIEQIIPRYAMESDVQYAKRTMSSSDLPLALANVAEKGLQESYNLQPKTFEAWTKSSTLRNYKAYSQVKSGDFPALIERPEGAEFELGSFGEDRETVQLKDYGIKLAFTSQMLVNDDMSVITRLTSETGASISDLENSKAYAALTTNKTMNDGVALYHADHGNLGSAGAINATTVAEAYKLMRKQTSTDGSRKLNLQPTILVCGPDKEAEALQFFAPVNATQTSGVNIYSGRMQVIVDAEITGNQFYFISPRIDGVVCYRLEGQEQPQVESQINFNTNSMELKVAHAFAAAPMDWRAIVKNAGN